MIIEIIIVLFFIDQISKILVLNNLYQNSIEIIPNILSFTYVENKGASFGIGQNFTTLFIVLNIILIIFLLYYVIKNKNKFNNYIKLAYLSIISGGLGNLADRMIRGFVVDFIDVNKIFEWPMFNIADIYIVLGCWGVILSIIISEKENKPEKS